MAEDLPLHVVLATAWIRKGDTFLLGKREAGDSQAAGHWGTVGGKVEMDVETDVVEKTLRREVMEEVGVEITDSFEYVCSDSFIRSSGHHVVKLVFLVDWKSGEAQPLDGQDEVKWFGPDEINQLLADNPHLDYLKPIWEKLQKMI